MMSYCFRVTPCEAAVSAAFDSGLTLKPTIIAFEAAPSITSLSVTLPTAEWMTSTETFGVDSFASAVFSASTEPCTSALTMIFRTLASSFLPLARMSSMESLLLFDRSFSRCRSEEHTSELQSLAYLVCRLLLEKKKVARSPDQADLNHTPDAAV